ncbi:hypothetical protein [Streptomyces bungoensis]|uniref:hypothetical protein n=1 Tax=Streptomyces bungoensis TaxID=285568 RepID=UPI0033E12E2B
MEEPPADGRQTGEVPDPDGVGLAVVKFRCSRPRSALPPDQIQDRRAMSLPHPPAGDGASAHHTLGAPASATGSPLSRGSKDQQAPDTLPIEIIERML